MCVDASVRVRVRARHAKCVDVSRVRVRARHVMCVVLC